MYNLIAYHCIYEMLILNKDSKRLHNSLVYLETLRSPFYIKRVMPDWFPIAIPLRATVLELGAIARNCAQFLGVYRIRNCAQAKSICVGNPMPDSRQHHFKTYLISKMFFQFENYLILTISTIINFQEEDDGYLTHYSLRHRF